ncbi:MAG TPA: hypothetical protein VM659_00945 [Dongiaceae bacterium]|nr:hypothetical protein [Dongiaceae bacterium]
MNITTNVQKPRLIDEAIVAVRAEKGWHLHAFECLPTDLPRYLAQTGLAHLPYRIVDHCRVAVGSFGKYLARPARRAGWQHWNEDIWFPMDEPMPELAGMPKLGTFSLRLRGIFFRTIVIVVRIDGRRFRCCLDTEEDSLIRFTQFAQLLAAGHYPHGVLFEGGSVEAITQQGPANGLCRFWTNPWHGGRQETIDIVVDRTHLIHQFTALAAAIADHPCFGHEFVLRAPIDDEEYESLSDAAEAEFARAISEGRIVVFSAADDMANEDAKADFVARNLAARFPLAADEIIWVERHKNMLRTLNIPAEWL